MDGVPTPRAVVARVATPPPFSVIEPSDVVPLKNVTMPVGVPPAELVTVAVNVTDCPATDGLSDEVMAVALALSTICVSTLEVLAAKLVSPP